VIGGGAERGRGWERVGAGRGGGRERERRRSVVGGKERNDRDKIDRREGGLDWRRPGWPAAVCAARMQTHILLTAAQETERRALSRGGGLGSRPIFKKFYETYAPS